MHLQCMASQHTCAAVHSPTCQRGRDRDLAPVCVRALQGRTTRVACCPPPTRVLWRPSSPLPSHGLRLQQGGRRLAAQPWRAPGPRERGPLAGRAVQGGAQPRGACVAATWCWAPHPCAPAPQPPAPFSWCCQGPKQRSGLLTPTPPCPPGGAVLQHLPQVSQPGVGRHAQHAAAVLVRLTCLWPCPWRYMGGSHLPPPPPQHTSHPPAHCCRVTQGCGSQSKATSCAAGVIGNNRKPRKPSRRCDSVDRWGLSGVRGTQGDTLCASWCGRTQERDKLRLAKVMKFGDKVRAPLFWRPFCTRHAATPTWPVC
jgi:hypothetical protein